MPLLKDRRISIKMEKAPEHPPTPKELVPLEQKVEMYMTFFERLAFRACVAVGATMGGYILLDTYRQCKVAKAQRPPQQ